MSDPKDHHYIPVFYLKAWCGKDGRLAQFERVGPRKELFKKRVYPRQKGFKSHLYTLPNVEPELRYWVEREFLGLVDRNSAKARDKLIATQDIKADPKLRDAWARFIMSTIHRNPEKIAELSRVWNEGYDENTRTLESRYESERGPDDPPDFASYLASQLPGTRERAFANLLKTMMDSEPIGTALNTMHWVVWAFPYTRKTLMTSDRPIVLPRGLAHDDSYVGVALSPRHMFIACNDLRRFELMRQANSAEKLVAAHNQVVAAQAKDYVYALDHSAASFVDRLLGHHPPQFLGWTPGQYMPLAAGSPNILDLVKAKAEAMRRN
jgi:hypothetical protein